MKNKGQIALAVGAGYLLGRRRKMRLALVLGTAAATGGFGGLAGQLLRRGAKFAASDGVLGKVSPEVGEITNLVRGDLLDAGKAAAMTAVRSRVDQMSDKLHDQAETWRQSHGEDQDTGDETAEEPADTAEELEEDYEDTRDEAAEDDDTGEPDDTEASYQESEDDEDDSQEAGGQPADSAGNGEPRSSRSRRTAPPVRRTRR
jgi:hypothetical protein